MLVLTGVAQAVLTGGAARQRVARPTRRCGLIYVARRPAGVAQSLQRPSREALIPRTVRHDELPAAVSRLVARHAGRHAGRPGDRRPARRHGRRRLVLRRRRRRPGGRHRAVRGDAAATRTTDESHAAQPGAASSRASATPLGRRDLLGTYLIDIVGDADGDADRAVPGVRQGRVPRSRELLGLLYTAESVGSLLATLTSGLDRARPPPRPGGRGRRDVLGRRRSRWPGCRPHGVARTGVPRRWPAPPTWSAGSSAARSGTRRSPTTCAAGWPASRCCPTRSVRSAARSAPVWSPTPRRCGPRSSAAACCAWSASRRPRLWLRDFWRYDDRTDEHAVRERTRRTAAEASPNP